MVVYRHADPVGYIEGGHDLLCKDCRMLDSKICSR